MAEVKSNYSAKIIFKNSVYSTVYKVASALLSLISAPLLLYCLGDEKYGAWATLLSLISWIYYCDLGIGNGLRNKLASTIVVNNNKDSKKYLGTAYVLLAGITFVVFLAAFFFFSIFDIGKWLGITFEGENVRICLVVAMLFACVNFIMSLANNVLYAVQRASLVNFFSCIAQLIFTILLGIYAVTGINTIFFMALGEGCSQLLKNILETLYVFKKNPNLKFSIRDYDKKYTGGILSFGLQMFLVQISALVLNSTDNIIITKLFGTAAVTPYNFCYKYFNMIQNLYVALITPLLSAYTAAYTLKDITWINKALKKNIILFIVFMIGTILAAFIFKPFSLIWLHKNLNFGLDLIVCTALYFVLLMLNHIYSTFLSGISCIKETTLATVAGTIINIPVSIFLAKGIGMGTSGVILGSAISLGACLIVAPIVTGRELRKLRSRS